MEACRRAAQLAGEDLIQKTWHDVNSLADPGILVDAARAALAADVIVVSIHAAHELPVELHVWIDTWMPHRRSRVGALTALVGVAESLESQSVRTFEYLQAVAREAQLDFFPHERRRPVPSCAPSIELITEPAGTNAQALQELYDRR